MSNDITRPVDNTKTHSPSPSDWIKQTSNQIWIVAIVIFAAGIAFYAFNVNQQNQMCPLFQDYQTTDAERHHILTALGVTKLDTFHIQEGKIFVPSAEKGKYLAAIKEENALPAIYKQTEEPQPSIFMSKSQQRIVLLNRKKQKVRDMILRLPFVSEVWFEMDWAKSDKAFQADQHSAVVMVRLKNQTALTKRQVKTIQGIVTGAIANIEARQVVVTDANVGISYQDLSDSEQSELIDMVNWKMKRRQHYLDQLQDLALEFPGLEIQVEVIQKGSGQPVDFAPKEKIASGVPSKLAMLPSHAPIQKNGKLSLNSTETASIDDPALFANPSIHAADENVITVGFEQTVAASPEKSTLSPPTQNSENVRIQIRVPQSLFAEYCSTSSKIDCKTSAQFAELKTRIIDRIRSIIPAETLAAKMPISVSMAADCRSRTADSKSLTDSISQFWPFIAVAVFGLIGLVWNRNGATSRVPVEHSIAAENSRANAEDLQNQLTNLIDDDPVAAAKVIKNWIRNSS